MMDLGIGFNEMQWLVLIIFSSIISSNIFFNLGVRAGIEEAIDIFESDKFRKTNYHEDS
tara:strand:+ start:1461 stop:1637 length:177 start_codon:yes stop_codon:yes gene_type:complete